MTSARRLVFRGVDVIDGTGAPRFAADVVVAGDRIAAVLPPGTAPVEGAELVDAPDRVLCPGFIDTHSHDDRLLLDHPAPHPKLAQGVCTVVTGNCGLSLAPLITDDPPAPLDLFGRDGFRHASFAAYLAELDAALPDVNVVPLIGHTSLRLHRMADVGRAASAAETAAMQADIAAALDAGAFGLSTGVHYAPAQAATAAELIAVARPLAARRALLTMHIRDEADRIDAAIAEALEVGRAAGVALVLSHHKVLGARNHGRTRQTLEAIAQAATTQAVCIDCYPYTASSTTLDPVRAAEVGEVLVTWSTAAPAQGGRRLRDIAVFVR